ncbi:hypothetical protein N656DRAFT_802901 [Canariomyces notabilis]|uniref:Uncharacterized protein n=1 Tax=Canariomyces notabilis TaxID=2074819 RepID=A0AAN6T7S6_9PEZI|nr:hypothetical protein N656DRAFT_802901 [Canariomyces arenarius]
MSTRKSTTQNPRFRRTTGHPRSETPAGNIQRKTEQVLSQSSPVASEPATQPEVQPEVPSVAEPEPEPEPRPKYVRPALNEPTRPPADTSSPEYKRAYFRWWSTVTALPFLIVTSYYLWQELVPNIGRRREQPPEQQA